MPKRRKRKHFSTEIPDRIPGTVCEFQDGNLTFEEHGARQLCEFFITTGLADRDLAEHLYRRMLGEGVGEGAVFKKLFESESARARLQQPEFHTLIERVVDESPEFAADLMESPELKPIVLPLIRAAGW